MAGRRDHDGDGHSPAVPTCCLHPPPVNGILRIHCMEDRGLIHVEGEGRQWIHIVDDRNNLLEETLGLVAHFFGGALHGVRGHAVDEAVFCHKARNGRFLGRESLVGESRTQLAGLLMRHRQETRIPFPCHSSTKDTSSSVKASTQPTGPSCRDCFSSLAASLSKA